MPTALELLAQVDALMRRNREEAAWAEIPVLTDVVETEHAATGDAQNIGESEQPASLPASLDDTSAAPTEAPATDTVLRSLDARSLDPSPPVPPESFLDAAVDSREIFVETTAPVEVETRTNVAASAAVDTEGGATESATPFDPRTDVEWWQMLSEDVRIQVMQRLDIFTDDGLQDELKLRLQPIVDRASAELVASIGRQVGQLLRSYVAESIEREIDKWRQDRG